MTDADQGNVAELPDDVMGIVGSVARRAVLNGLESIEAGADADFDRLAQLAATIFDAPVALVSLVDIDRQWFKARVGLDATGTPVGASFCAHAIAAEDDVTVVPDAQADPRFAANPLVTSDPFIRFYTGAPIVVSGQRIGTVCVIDTVARERPGAPLLDQLTSLAALAGSLFLLKDRARRGGLASAALVREEKRHALALEAATIASWVWDVRTGVVECDSLLPVLFNLPHATRIQSRDIFGAIDARDVARTEQRLREAMRTSDDYSGEYRIRDTRPERWLAARGRVVERDADGAPVLVFGVNFDITERRASEERQRLLLREINHRVKNTLASVQALATQTVRHARRPEEFLTAFNGRLQALGRTHGLLSDHEWRSVNLEDLVRLELQTMHPEDRERIRMTGEPVTLTPDQALALSLILHELASNAVNHGSLSVDGGGVELTWGTTADSQRLSLDWVEHGGPKVAPPQTKGFGSILIRRSLDKVLSSAVTHEFDPDGVRARLDIPLEGREA